MNMAAQKIGERRTTGARRPVTDVAKWIRRTEPLTQRQIYKLCAEAAVAERTVRRWAMGDPSVLDGTKERIGRAAARLGIRMA
jgi:siroheme synthase